MLDKIKEIKVSGFRQIFSQASLNNRIAALQAKGFFDQEAGQFESEGEVKLLQSPDDVMQIAKKTGSCLYDPRRVEKVQLECYKQFLEDPSVLYFSLSSRQIKGYFRFYAGEKQGPQEKVGPKGTEMSAGSEVILFEDILRTESTGKLFYNEPRAVIFSTIAELGLLDRSYLQMLYDRGDCQIANPLLVRKLGNRRYFKKGIKNVEFYKGDQLIENLEFVLARDLL